MDKFVLVSGGSSMGGRNSLSCDVSSFFHSKGDQMYWIDTVDEKRTAIFTHCKCYLQLLLFTFFISFLFEPGCIF